MKFAIKVIPQAPRSQLIGWENDELVIKIKAPPEDGKANKELIHFLAKLTHTPKSEILILRGETSRHKLLEIPETAVENIRSMVEN